MIRKKLYLSEQGRFFAWLGGGLAALLLSFACWSAVSALRLQAALATSV